MSLRINTNIAAMDAYKNLSVSDSKMQDSLQKLSSGYRINKAADDAAGLAVSEGLKSQIGGLTVAARNAQDGVNVVQTADGALGEVTSILQRMRDLAVQASNTGSEDSNATAASQSEFTQLNSELDRISATTSFGQTNLLDGTFGTAYKAADVSGSTVDLSTTGVSASDNFTVALGGGSAKTVNLTAAAAGGTAGKYTNDTAGAAALQTALQTDLDRDLGSGALKATVAVSAGKLKVTLGTPADSGTAAAAELNVGASSILGISATDNAGTADSATTAKAFQVGANGTANDQISFHINSVDSTSLGTKNLDLTTGAQAAIGTIDAAITSVSSERANLGAIQNRFSDTIDNLNTAIENVSASESSIVDVDMASEMTNYTKMQVLQQAGTAMLAQANQSGQGVLKLLQ